MRLWKNNDGTRQGKYLVLRRDGSVPEWPYFVIGARDPAAPGALMEYAEIAEDIGLDPAYVSDVRALADEFEAYRRAHDDGDPDAPPHRKDNPEIIEKMEEAKGS